MTRYRLPEALGGGEFEAAAVNDSGQYIGFDFPGFGTSRQWFPLTVLTPVAPPLPPEPPVGSVVLDKDGHAWQRIAEGEKAWWCVLDSADTDWADLNEYGQVTLLVPEVTP